MLSDALPSASGLNSVSLSREDPASAIGNPSAEGSPHPQAILANYHICFTGYREEDYLFAESQDLEGRSSTFCRSSTNDPYSAGTLLVPPGGCNGVRGLCNPYEGKNSRNQSPPPVSSPGKQTTTEGVNRERQTPAPPSLVHAHAFTCDLPQSWTLNPGVKEKEGIGGEAMKAPPLRSLDDYKKLAESLGARVANTLSRRAVMRIHKEKEKEEKRVVNTEGKNASSSFVLVAWRGLTRKRLIAEQLAIPTVLPRWLELNAGITSSPNGSGKGEKETCERKGEKHPVALSTLMFAVPWLHGYIFSTSRMITAEEETLRILVQRHGGVIQPFLNQHCDALLVSAESAEQLRTFLQRLSRGIYGDGLDFGRTDQSNTPQSSVVQKRNVAFQRVGEATEGISRKILVAWRCDIPVLDYTRFLRLAGLVEEQNHGGISSSIANSSHHHHHKASSRLDFDSIAETCRIGPPPPERLREIVLPTDAATDGACNDKNIEALAGESKDNSPLLDENEEEEEEEDENTESLTSYASSFHDVAEMGEEFLHTLQAHKDNEEGAAQTMIVDSPDYYSGNTFQDKGGMKLAFGVEETGMKKDPAPSERGFLLGQEDEEVKNAKSPCTNSTFTVNIIDSYYAKQNASRDSMQSRALGRAGDDDPRGAKLRTGFATPPAAIHDKKEDEKAATMFGGAPSERMWASALPPLSPRPLVPIRPPFLTISFLGCGPAETTDGARLAAVCRFLRLPFPTSAVDVVILGGQLLRKRRLRMPAGEIHERGAFGGENGEGGAIGVGEKGGVVRAANKPTPRHPLRGRGGVVFYTTPRALARGLAGLYGIPSGRLVRFAWLRAAYEALRGLADDRGGPQNDGPSSTLGGGFSPAPPLGAAELPSPDDPRYAVRAWSPPAAAEAPENPPAKAPAKDDGGENAAKRARPAAPPRRRPGEGRPPATIPPAAAPERVRAGEEDYQTEIAHAHRMLNGLLGLLSSPPGEAERPSGKRPTGLLRGVIVCFTEGDFARINLAVVRGLVNFGRGRWMKKTRLEWLRMSREGPTHDSKRRMQVSDDGEVVKSFEEGGNQRKGTLEEDNNSNEAPTAAMLEEAVRKNMYFGKLKKLLLRNPLASFEFKPPSLKSAQRIKRCPTAKEEEEEKKENAQRETLSGVLAGPQAREPLSRSDLHLFDEGYSITELSMAGDLEEIRSAATSTAAFPPQVSQSDEKEHEALPKREPNNSNSSRQLEKLRIASLRCRQPLALHVIPHFYQQLDTTRPTLGAKSAHASSTNAHARGDLAQDANRSSPTSSPLRYLPRVTSDYLLCCLASGRLLDPKACFTFHTPIPRSTDAALRLRRAQGLGEKGKKSEKSATGPSASFLAPSSAFSASSLAFPGLSPWMWERRYAKPGSLGVCVAFVWVLPEAGGGEEIAGEAADEDAKSPAREKEIAPLIRSLDYGLRAVVRALGGAVRQAVDPAAVTHVVVVDVIAVLSGALHDLYGGPVEKDQNEKEEGEAKDDEKGRGFRAGRKAARYWPPGARASDEVARVSLRWLEESMHWGVFVDERAPAYAWRPPPHLHFAPETSEPPTADAERKEGRRAREARRRVDDNGQTSREGRLGKRHRSLSSDLVPDAPKSPHARPAEGKDDGKPKREEEEEEEEGACAHEPPAPPLTTAFNFRTPVKSTENGGGGAPPFSSSSSQSRRAYGIRSSAPLPSPIRQLDEIMGSTLYSRRKRARASDRSPSTQINAEGHSREFQTRLQTPERTVMMKVRADDKSDDFVRTPLIVGCSLQDQACTPVRLSSLPQLAKRSNTPSSSIYAEDKAVVRRTASNMKTEEEEEEEEEAQTTTFDPPDEAVASEPFRDVEEQRLSTAAAPNPRDSTQTKDVTEGILPALLEADNLASVNPIILPSIDMSGVRGKRTCLDESPAAPLCTREETIICSSSSSNSEGVAKIHEEENKKAEAASLTAQAKKDKEGAPGGKGKVLQVYILHDLPGREALLERFKDAVENLIPSLPHVMASTDTNEERPFSPFTDDFIPYKKQNPARVPEKMPQMAISHAFCPILFVDDYRRADCLVAHDLSPRESVLAAIAAGLWLLQPAFISYVVEKLETERRGEAVDIFFALERFAWEEEALPPRAPAINHALAKQSVLHRQRRQAGKSRVFDQKVFILCFLDEEKGGDEDCLEDKNDLSKDVEGRFGGDCGPGSDLSGLPKGKGTETNSKTDPSKGVKIPPSTHNGNANPSLSSENAGVKTKRQKPAQTRCDWKKKVAPIARLVHAGGGILLCTARIHLNCDDDTKENVVNNDKNSKTLSSPNRGDPSQPPLVLSAMDFSSSSCSEWVHSKVERNQGESTFDLVQKASCGDTILEVFSTLLCTGALACCRRYCMRADGDANDPFGAPCEDGNRYQTRPPSAAREPSGEALAAPELTLLMDSTLLNKKSIPSASPSPCMTLRSWWSRVFRSVEDAEPRVALRRILQNIQQECRACLPAGGSNPRVNYGVFNPYEDGIAPSNPYDGLTLTSARFLGSAYPTEVPFQRARAEDADLGNAAVRAFVGRVRQNAEKWVAELNSVQEAEKKGDLLGRDQMLHITLRQLVGVKFFSVRIMSWLARELIGQRGLDQDHVSCVGTMSLE